jgi:hypothetical protein
VDRTSIRIAAPCILPPSRGSPASVCFFAITNFFPIKGIKLSLFVHLLSWFGILAATVRLAQREICVEVVHELENSSYASDRHRIWCSSAASEFRTRSSCNCPPASGDPAAWFGLLACAAIKDTARPEGQPEMRHLEHIPKPGLLDVPGKPTVTGQTALREVLAHQRIRRFWTNAVGRGRFGFGKGRPLLEGQGLTLPFLTASWPACLLPRTCGVISIFLVACRAGLECEVVRVKKFGTGSESGPREQACDRRLVTNSSPKHSGELFKRNVPRHLPCLHLEGYTPQGVRLASSHSEHFIERTSL